MKSSYYSLDTPASRGLVMRSDNSASLSQKSIRNPPASLEGFGEALFKGAVAAPYLVKQGLSDDVLESSAWIQRGLADKVRENELIFGLTGIQTLLGNNP